MGVGQELILVVLQIIREGEMICLNHYICVEFCQMDKSKTKSGPRTKKFIHIVTVLLAMCSNLKKQTRNLICQYKLMMTNVLCCFTKSYNIAALMLLVQSAGPVQIFTSTKDITCTPYL